MKKLLMLVTCAALLSSNCARPAEAQGSPWFSRGYRGLSTALTGIPGILGFGWYCFGAKQDTDNDVALQKFVGFCGALLLVETAYKSSWYFSKPDCGTCATHKNNA